MIRKAITEFAIDYMVLEKYSCCKEEALHKLSDIQQICLPTSVFLVSKNLKD